MIAFVYGPERMPPMAANHLASRFNTNHDNAQAIGLIHELLGHVLPSLGITNVTDSMAIERIIRRELGWGTNLGFGRGSENSIVGKEYNFDLNRARVMR